MFMNSASSSVKKKMKLQRIKKATKVNMRQKCTVNECQNIRKKNGIAFFKYVFKYIEVYVVMFYRIEYMYIYIWICSRFPLNDKTLLEKWTVAIHKTHCAITANSRICERHFKKEFFSGKERKRLKINAVPTECLTSSDPLQELNALINLCKCMNL